MSNRSRDWLLRVHEYFTKNWFLSAVLVTIPALGFAFVELFGRNFEWIDSGGKLVNGARIVLTLLFFISLLFSLIKSYADSDIEKARRNGQFVLDKMLQGVNTIKYKKVQRFVEYIDGHHRSKSGLSPFFEITQPKKQISVILDVAQETLSEIFGIKRENISISVVYKTDKNKDWSWLYQWNIENDLTLEELLQNPNSTLRKMIDGKRNLIFHPDKRKGIEKQEYVTGRSDQDNNNIGSIFCKDISLTTDHKYIHAIMNVSTYGNQLCEEWDNEARNKIEKIILPAIERRLQLELSLLYIRDVIADPNNSKPAKRKPKVQVVPKNNRNKP